MASWTVTEPQRITLDGAGPITRLDVSLNAGRLSVVGTDSAPRVEISRASEIPILIDLTDGRLSVVHEATRPWPGPLTPLWWWLHGRHKFDADVSIAVPHETLAQLFIASGSMVASSLHADVTADCVSGRVTLFGIDGGLRAKVISGPIEALGCAGAIELETVSGEITLADTAADRVRAKTVSGSITADLDNPPRDCDIRLETISGEITIRIRADSDLTVTLGAVHGRVTSEFAGLSGTGSWASTASGKLGAGTGRLFANAVGGNIALLRRPVDDDFSSTDFGADDFSSTDVEADDIEAADSGAGDRS